MIKKLSCYGLLLLCSMSLSCFAEIAAQNNPPAPNANAPVSSSTEVTIAPSTMQLNQIKPLFDQSDYQHLHNNEAIKQKTLLLPEPAGKTP
jgi:hypothetical protein